jgi:adenosylcobinamide-phosphate synthase
MTQVEMLVVALILDALVGDPKLVWSRVPHPVVLMGRLIDRADRMLNRGGARVAKGAVALGVLGAGVGLIAWALALVPDFGALEVLGAAILLSHRSLIRHVRAVATALAHDLGAGRAAVARIVGRDTADLDESGVARAAIESAAESFADGVVAPAFWFLVLGLPGIALYKFVNTADSMIGHLDERYALFGRAAARLDDLMNWIPARIAGVLISIAALRQSAGDVMMENASLHASPNAGWPEAAMAGALDIALAGPRSYDGVPTDDPWMNPRARRVLGVRDIDRSLVILWRAWFLVLVLVVTIEAMLWASWTGMTVFALL